MANSAQNPVVTSDLSTGYLTRAITASFLGMLGRLPTDSELGYWIGKAQNADQYSDNIWRIGWNAYWESRVNGSGSSDPRLGDQPARFQPDTPIPVPTPTPVPIPSDDHKEILNALTTLFKNQVEMMNKLNEIANVPDSPIPPPITFPVYKSSGWLSITLTPVVR